MNKNIRKARRLVDRFMTDSNNYYQINYDNDTRQARRILGRFGKHLCSIDFVLWNQLQVITNVYYYNPVRANFNGVWSQILESIESGKFDRI